MILVENKLHIAHIGDFCSVFKGFIAVGKQLAQLLLALEVEFVCGKLHLPVGVIQSRSGLNAKQNILHFRVLFAKIMGIIGNHQRQPRFPGKPPDTLVGSTLFLDAMILQLQIEVTRSKDLGKLQRVIFCALIVITQNMLGYRTGQAGRQGNETLMILFKQRKVYPGLAVKTVDIGFRNQKTQVFIALTVLTKQDKMIRAVVDAVYPVLHGSPGNVHLAANDGLDARCLGGFIKVNTAIHDTMVCNGNGRLTQLLNPVHHATDAASTIQKAVFRVDMQMYKTHLIASLESSTSFFSR